MGPLGVRVLTSSCDLLSFSASGTRHGNGPESVSNHSLPAGDLTDVAARFRNDCIPETIVAQKVRPPPLVGT